jgi:hypothetical protein
MPFRSDLDPFQFAIELRRLAQFESPAKQAVAFARGRAHGFRIKTLAGMAGRSQSHVRRMLRLLALPFREWIAVSRGAPYGPLLSRLSKAA